MDIKKNYGQQYKVNVENKKCSKQRKIRRESYRRRERARERQTGRERREGAREDGNRGKKEGVMTKIEGQKCCGVTFKLLRRLNSVTSPLHQDEGPSLSPVGWSYTKNVDKREGPQSERLMRNETDHCGKLIVKSHKKYTQRNE